MGVAMAEAYPAARQLLDVAGPDVVEALHRGRALRATSRAQPAMVAVGLGAFEALAARGVAPEVTLGHSLGELSAWAATGAIGSADAVRLAAARGVAMERAATRRPGGMLALSTADLAVVARALEAGEAVGSIAIAAHNAVDEWVLTGDDAALRAAAREAPSRRLAVSGPWHAPSMRDAADAFGEALAQLPVHPPRARMVANATGELAPADAIPRLLVRQLARPVRWARSMRSLARLGVTDLITCGPGKVLRHLARGVDGMRAHACEEPRDVERLAQILGS